MKRQLFSAFLMISLLISMLGFAFNTRLGKAEGGTIYIRADGSIDPPDAPISTVDNVTYTLTDNVASDADGLIVEKDGIVVDGAGYTLQGSGSGTGIDLSNRNNVTIKSTSVRSYDHGVYLDESYSISIIENNVTDNGDMGVGVGYSSNNTIVGNNMTNNGDGVMLYLSSNNSINWNNMSDRGFEMRLYASSNNSIVGNNFTSGLYGIVLDGSSNNSITGNEFFNDGLSVRFSYQNSVENNTVNGKRLAYLEDLSDYSVADAGQIVLVRCRGIMIEDLNLSRTLRCILLCETNDTVISENTVKGDAESIMLDGSFNNSITKNNITSDKGSGIGLYRSSHNSIDGNNITANDWGSGIYLDNSYNNSITENSIENNENGITLSNSSDNIVCHNNFISNTRQVYDLSWDDPSDPPSTNMFDNGYPSGGNYWSDYSGIDVYTGPYQNLTGTDGISDVPYVIDANNTDRYPLMNQYVARLRLLGDVNDDGMVNMRDVLMAVQAFNSFRGYPRWNIDADLDGSGRVDMKDILTIVLNFNKHE